MEKIRIALLGFGTVGRGVAKLLEQNGELIRKRLGAEIEISKILVRDVKKKRYGGFPKEFFTTEIEDILEDEEIEIVIEVMGGIIPAREYVLQSFLRGKHVVSANKEMISRSLKELSEAAYLNGCRFLFEASVGGAVPILRTLKRSMSADKIEEIYGIVNGTTNYILTKMKEEDMSFEGALRRACELGYAEEAATDDVEGIDSARKIAILASLAFHTPIDVDDVYVEGIGSLTRKDIALAERMGRNVKLLASAKDGEKVELEVFPCFLSNDALLAGVKDEFNAIVVKGNGFGESLLYGKGAGELPTASAVLSDVIEVCKTLLNKERVQRECLFTDTKEVGKEEKISEVLIRLKKIPFVSEEGIREVFTAHGVQLLEDISDEEEWIYHISSMESDRVAAEKALIREQKISETIRVIRIWN